MKKTIQYIITSSLIILFSVTITAQQKPTKKVVTAKTTQISSTNTKVKTYKITANSSDNQIFGYVTVVPVDTTGAKTNKVKNK